MFSGIPATEVLVPKYSLDENLFSGTLDVVRISYGVDQLASLY